jgi:filamentous hemagglutinin family protein
MNWLRFDLSKKRVGQWCTCPHFWMSLLLGLGTAGTATAQIIPDDTLPAPSTVNPDTANPNLWRITGGTVSSGGHNLFHSFSRFSLGAGQTAWFDQVGTIDNIFTRITGPDLSTIDGILRVNSTANLFLLNPNGILFGPNARLNLGGSFLATTADRVLFNQGFFSATAKNTPPLLALNLPVGLQMGSNPGAITLNGAGHNLSTTNSIFQPPMRGTPATPLKVNPGQSLVLLGGDLLLNGGVVLAEQGHVELGSLKSGSVGLSLGNPTLGLSYQGGENLGDIRLWNRSIVDVSANPGNQRAGSIQVQGRNVELRNGSALFIQNAGVAESGTLRVNASESLGVFGTDANGLVRTLIANNTLGQGNAGSIYITTPDLTVQDGGTITTSTFGVGNGGELTIDADTLRVSGVSSFNLGTVSAIAAATYLRTPQAGHAGQIRISAQALTVENGGSIISSTFGLGDGGNVTIDANNIRVSGVEPTLFTPGIITTSTFYQGNAGSLVINTDRLSIENGGRVDSSNLAFGAAGSVTINAQDVTVTGQVPGSRNPSFLASSANITDPTLQRLLRLPPVPQGPSGDLTLNTDRLQVTDGGLVSVSNEGRDRAGSLTIRANSIFLDTQGRITGATASGEGGNIALQVGSTLVMRRGSQITTEAGGTGNGGNIQIQTPFLLARSNENSDIVANAFEGNGGSIQIQATSILGINFRDSLTPRSDIVASSEFGVSGNVTLTQPEVDLTSGLEDLPTDFLDTTLQVTNRCSVSSGSSFTATGQGGLPENPIAPIQGQTLWSDPAFSTLAQSPTGQPVNPDQKLLREATGMLAQPDGQIVLVGSKIEVGFDLTQTGVQLFNQGRTGAALDTWKKAQQAYEQAQDKTGRQGSQLNQAQALQSLGQYRRALSLLIPLVKELQDQPDSLLKADVLRSLGTVLQATGDFEQAKTVLEQSWTIGQTLQAPQKVSAALFSIGNVARDVKQPEVALNYYQEALKHNPVRVGSPQENRLLQLQILLNQFSLLVEESKPDAQSLISQIEAALKPLPPDRATIYARINFAESLIQLGRSPETIAPLLIQAQSQADQLQDKRAKSYVLGQLGRLYQQHQQWQKALQFTEQSLTLAQSSEATDIVARIAKQFGEILEQVGDLQGATIAYQIAVEALQNLRNDLIAISPDVQFSFQEDVEPTYRELVRLLLTGEEQESSEFLLRRGYANGVRSLEEENSEFGVRSSEFGVGLNSEFSSHVTSPQEQSQTPSPETYSESQIQSTPNPVRLAAPEEKLPTPNPELQLTPNPELRSHSVSKGETPNSELKLTPNSEPRTPNSELRTQTNSELRTPNSELRTQTNSELRTPNSELRTQTNSEPRTPNSELQEARDVIEALQLAELDNFFGDACLQTQSVQIDSIDDRAAVFYPIVLPDRLEVIVSLPHQPLRHYSTPLPAQEITSTLQELYSAFHPGYPRDRRLQLSQQVYDWLIRPAEAALGSAGIQTLVFVLDEDLRSLPMAALHDGNQYLIEKYAVALSPGLHLLAPSSQAQSPGILAAGLTEARQGFNAIPAVSQEVQAISQTVKHSTVLLNQGFTRETLESALDQNPVSIVHLATHAQFSTDPSETFLLTWNDRINVKDFDRLFQSNLSSAASPHHTPIDLLVMSACQTATGDRRSALGLAGFALRSGARSTLASLWSVNDQSTAALMSEFYRQLNQSPQISKAEALRQAQLSLLHNPQYQHPYFWSAFILVGNWL